MEEIVLDNAAESFAADVMSIASQYRRDGEPISTRYVEKIEQARKLEKEAREEYRRDAIKHNEQYAARIWHAANIRKKRASHPEHIDAAASSIVILMGGVNNDIITGMTDDEAANARRKLIREESKRLQREEMYRQLAPEPGKVF